MSLVKLEKNIINSLGSKGQAWLNNLPLMIEKLSKLWCLTDIAPVNNMSWNYVATGLMHNKESIVLKISSDKQLIFDEFQTLQHWNGHGAIRVIHFQPEYQAMLLERAIPGTLLKEWHPDSSEKTIPVYAAVVKAIAGSKPLKNQHYKHVRDWLNAIDKITDPRINSVFIEKARTLRTHLLKTATHEYLCHGDLHLENIIYQTPSWLAIDPKGIIGEMAFEAAAFDLIDKNAPYHPDASSLLLKRCQLLAKSLDLDVERLLSWIFLRIILSAQWFVEDKGDPSDMLKLAESVYPLLKSLDLSFVPLKANDLPLLHTWFQEPVVQKAFAHSQPLSLNAITEKYLPRILGEERIFCYIVQIDDQPVAFIQTYSLNDYLPEGISSANNALFHLGTPHEMAGIDLFIASESCRGKELGVNIVQQFIALFLQSNSHVIVDPDLDNIAAIRCYEKCGFVATVYSEDLKHIIMKYRLNG